MQPESTSYPFRVRADLDPGLSRWQWLVKWWLLAIPHYLILFAVFTGGWRLRRLRFAAADRDPADRRSGGLTVHRPLSKGLVRLHNWHKPMGNPGTRLQLAAARRIPTATSGHRWAGTRLAAAAYGGGAPGLGGGACPGAGWSGAGFC